MSSEEIIDLLEEHGVKVTANRMLVAGAIAKAGRPVTLTDLETDLETVDKSSIFRALSVFREAHVVHVLEDVGDGVRYELCHSHHSPGDDDLHVHFYCTRCRKVYCLEEIPIPEVPVPEGFEVESANHMLRGLCPSCRRLG